MELKISDTTKKQRAEIVKEAFEISITGNMRTPSDKAQNYIEEYINGNLELDEVHQKILDIYKNNN